MAALVAKGAVQPVRSPPQVVSPLLVVVRHDKKRLAVDFRYVNQFLEVRRTQFRYETIGLASQLLQLNGDMLIVDIEGAYHHVDMHPDSWDNLGFQWQGQYYVFTFLPYDGLLGVHFTLRSYERSWATGAAKAYAASMIWMTSCLPCASPRLAPS